MFKSISIFKITVFSSCEDLAGEEGKEWTLKYLKFQGLSEIWKVYIFGNSLILKDASKDFEWLVEDDTFTHAKFASKPKKKNAKCNVCVPRKEKPVKSNSQEKFITVNQNKFLT